MAELIVDRFETIQVQVEQRQAIAAGLAALLGAWQVAFQGDAVGQAGEGVVVGEIFHDAEGVLLVSQALHQMADRVAECFDLPGAFQLRYRTDFSGAEAVRCLGDLPQGAGEVAGD